MPPGSSCAGGLNFSPQNFSPADIPHPWYSRPRIVGPAAFCVPIANSVHGPEFAAPETLLVHTSAMVRSTLKSRCETPEGY